ncbi:DUF2189 domain-containing protein [Methyloversatilis thermotolerans]|uniref:DUF2189 domain-containing protein n=1 Tax=Methyloversatilis thermotolerans TaxID=1346290 RepID=UPI00036E64FD|nr:DUF2189 domain-containing protein [Methyloversatilis thermotolerans]
MNDSQALIESRVFTTRTVPLGRPLTWLVAGCRDFLACPWPGLSHGLAVALFGYLLCWFIPDQFWLLAGAFSGFMLVAPVVATGLYATSRALEGGARVSAATVLRAWLPHEKHLVVFGLLLALAGSGWVVTSASLIKVFAAAPVTTPEDFLRVVVLAEEGWLFEGWMALGGLLAAPVFASSVVAIPMLMEHDISVMGAVLTSWRTVLDNPAPLALWATAIAGFTLFGMATALVGMLVVVPLLGHASWHAYRDLVPRNPQSADARN